MTCIVWTENGSTRFEDSVVAIGDAGELIVTKKAEFTAPAGAGFPVPAWTAIYAHGFWLKITFEET